MATARFNRTAPTATPATKQYTPRYSGLKASKPRPPFLGVGEYLLEVTEADEGKPTPNKDGEMRQSAIITFAVREVYSDPSRSVHAVDDTVAVAFRLLGKGSISGQQRMADFMIAAAGCNTEEEFAEVSKDGALVDAFFGHMTPYPEFTGATLVGTLVAAKGTSGNAILRDDVPTGDHYTNIAWQPVIANDSGGP